MTRRTLGANAGALPVARLADDRELAEPTPQNQDEHCQQDGAWFGHHRGAVAARIEIGRQRVVVAQVDVCVSVEVATQPRVRSGGTDGDGDIDLSDYNALASNFQPLGYGAVPEPSTALLALLGMLLISVFGRLSVLN